MTTLSSIAPGPTDRALFVGQTGSGKTTLAQYLAASRPYVVALDPKGTLKWPGFTRVTTWEAAAGLSVREHPRVIYAPDFHEMNDAEAINHFFAWVYERRNCTLYIDELYAVSTSTQFPEYMQACYTRGRERRVETWGATQRPARIPQMCITESEHIYCFRLRAPQDREKLEEVAAIPAEAIAALPKHRFIYAPQDGDVSGQLTLRLPR